MALQGQCSEDTSQWQLAMLSAGKASSLARSLRPLYIPALHIHPLAAPLPVLINVTLLVVDKDGVGAARLQAALLLPLQIVLTGVGGEAPAANESK